MPIEDEREHVERTYREHYQRVVYGRAGYRERVQPHLTLEAEWALVKRFQNGALVVEEHCPSWIGNRRDHGY